jgi:hypothetical protein
MKYTIISVFALCTGQLMAQGDKPKGFENSSRDVVSGTNIKLISASRINIEPAVPQTEAPKINIDFKTPQFSWTTQKYIQNISPEIIKERSQDSIYLSNYLRLGAGNNSHLLGEIYLSNRPNNKWAYNLSAQHFNANNVVRDQKVGNTRVDMNGSRFFNNSSVTTRLYYHRDLHTFFGKDTSISQELNSERVFSISENGKIAQNYGFNIDYISLANRKKPEFKWLNSAQLFETNFKHQEMELASTLRFNSKLSKFSLFGDLSTNFIQSNQHSDTGLAQKNNQLFIDVLPRVKFYHKPTDFNVIGGINVNHVQNTLDSASSKTYVNAHIEFEKGITGLEMKLYGGFDGGLRKNSIRRIHDQMPFFIENQLLKNSYEQYNVFVGIKGKISNQSLFYMDFGGNSIIDQLMFASVSNKADTLRSNIDSLRGLKAVYNTISTVYFRVGAEYLLGEKIKVSGNLKVLNYGSDDVYWHLPSLMYDVTAHFTPIETVKIKVGLTGMGNRNNQILLESNKVKVDPVGSVLDLHARIDYRFKEKGRIWIQGSNLLNKNYQMWYGMPNYGITVMGGISLGLF